MTAELLGRPIRNDKSQGASAEQNCDTRIPRSKGNWGSARTANRSVPVVGLHPLVAKAKSPARNPAGRHGYGVPRRTHPPPGLLSCAATEAILVNSFCLKMLMSDPKI